MTRSPFEDNDVAEAAAIVAEILGLADTMPEPGWDFAESVAERARGILATIEDRQEVTDRQWDALENMRGGLLRWFER